MLHLNASVLPAWSTDYVALLDLATNSHRKLTITNLPAESQGIWAHASDVWTNPSDPNALTVFLNSHRPPKNRAVSAESGADSVIEVRMTLDESGSWKTHNPFRFSRRPLVGIR